MAHVQDLWFTDDPDNPKRKVKTRLHGKGMRYRVRWVDPTGGERSKSFPDKKKGEAEAFLTATVNSLLERSYVDPNLGKTPFVDVKELWLRTTSPDPNSRKTKVAHVDGHVTPFFEKHTIAAAGKVSAVQDWLEWLSGRRYHGRPLAPSYRGQLFQHLRSIMAFAERKRYITDNPCLSEDLVVPKAPKRVLVPWDKGKVDAIWEALEDRYKVVVVLGAGLGLRRGEMLGLDLAQDVNRADSTIHVQRQIRRIGNDPLELVWSLPKHNKTRIVPASARIIEELDEHARRFPAKAATLPWTTMDGHSVTVSPLIVSATDTPVYGENFSESVWRPTVRRSGIQVEYRQGGTHQLRHFYASHLLSDGVSVRELADYLGHTDPAVTLRIYTHQVKSSHSRSRDAADRALGFGSDPGTAQGRHDDLGDEPDGAGLDVIDLDE